MFKFIKKQKVIIMIIAVVMMITGAQTYSLAVTDTTPPKITANTKAGRIKAGSEISFTITDESPLDVIYYQWDRNIDSNSNKVKQYLSEEYTNYVFKTTAPTELGLHEFSIAAKDHQKNLTYWFDVPYYVVANDVPADYVDNVKPTFKHNGDYPSSGSTIAQGRTFTIEMIDENDI